jgi:glycosyltransferase involved in cell wall biosynthesis
MSLPEEIHIVTHQVPWPVDFGGVFDLFYKIKSLSETGIKIHLHCYTKNGDQAPILERFCATVNYYPRTSFFSGTRFHLPYIVRSRSSQKLIENLRKDTFPIIFEGIHTTFPLLHDLGKDRKIKIRLHNVEFMYYRRLAELETDFFRKLYFKLESFLLKSYEKKMARLFDFWSVSEKDAGIYKNQLHCKNISFLPVFLPWKNVSSPSGLGSYCLYHGNLEVNENIKAVEWLLDEVFSKNEIPLVIAGKNPSPSLKQKVYQYKHTCIVENLSEHELEDLISKAQINILPSFNHTGIKLKVIHALFKGRHCLVNQEAIEGSGIETGYEVFDGSIDLSNKIEHYFNLPFTEEDLNKRVSGLKRYDNEGLAAEIKTWLC